MDMNWRFAHGGGSDVPILFGESPWHTVQDLYREKHDRIPLHVDNKPKLAWRYSLEKLVARNFQKETGLKLATWPVAEHPQFPRLSCHVDRMITDPERTGRGVLEIKTANPGFFRACKLKGAPNSFILQLTHNMIVTGREWGMICIANTDDGELLYWDIELDEQLASRIMDAWDKFWWHVDHDEMPSLPEAKQEVVPQVARGELVVLEDAAFGQAVVDYLIADQLTKEAGELKQLARMQLGDIMEHTGSDVVEGFGVRIYNREVKGRRTINTKALRAAHPDLAEQFTKTGKPYRTFRLYQLRGEIDGKRVDPTKRIGADND